MKFFQKPSSSFKDPSGDACIMNPNFGFCYEPPSDCVLPARQRELGCLVFLVLAVFVRFGWLNCIYMYCDVIELFGRVFIEKKGMNSCVIVMGFKNGIGGKSESDFRLWVVSDFTK